MLRNRKLLVIFLILFFEILSITVIFYLLPLYVEKLGFTPTMIGVLTATYSACSLISVPFLAYLSDHWGRRKILLFCQAGTFLSILLLLVAQTPVLIFLSIIVDGFTGGNYAIAEAYISDVTEPEERVAAFSKSSTISYMGLILGPLLAGILAVHDFRWPIIAGAVFSLLSILVTGFFLPTGVPANEIAGAKEEVEKVKFELMSYLKLFKNSVLLPYFVQFGLFVIAFHFYLAGLAMFLERRFGQNGQMFGPKEVSYVFITIGVYAILFQTFILGKLQKKWGEGGFIKVAFACSIIGFFLLGAIREPYLLFLVFVFIVFGNGSIPQTLTGVISKNVSAKQQGMVMGLLSAMRSVCQIALPPIAGLMIQEDLLSAWAWAPCPFLLVAFITTLKAKANKAPSLS